MDEKLKEYFGAIANGYTLVDRGMIIDDFKRIYLAGCAAQSQADHDAIIDLGNAIDDPMAVHEALDAAAIVEKT